MVKGCVKWEVLGFKKFGRMEKKSDICNRKRETYGSVEKQFRRKFAKKSSKKFGG